MPIDRKELLLASNYARALISIESSTQKQKKIIYDLRVVLAYLLEDSRLKSYLFNRYINSREQKNVLKQFLQNIVSENEEISQTIRSLLFALIQRHRLHLIQNIVEKLELLLNKKLNISTIYVRTGATLSDKQRENIERKLLASLSSNKRTNKDGIKGDKEKGGNTNFVNASAIMLDNIKCCFEIDRDLIGGMTILIDNYYFLDLSITKYLDKLSHDLKNTNYNAQLEPFATRRSD